MQPSSIHAGEFPPGYFRFTPAEFLELMGGDIPIAVDIIETAQVEAAAQQGRIAAIPVGGDADTTSRMLHAMRGSVANFGAEPLVELLREMEAACKQGGNSAVLSFMQQFTSECACYQKGLACFLAALRAVNT